MQQRYRTAHGRLLPWQSGRSGLMHRYQVSANYHRSERGTCLGLYHHRWRDGPALWACPTAHPTCPTADSGGAVPATDAAEYPCPPTAAQIAAGDNCTVSYGDPPEASSKSAPISYIPAPTPGSGTTTTTARLQQLRRPPKRLQRQRLRPRPAPWPSLVPARIPGTHSWAAFCSSTGAS